MRGRSFAFRPVSGAKKKNPSSRRFSIDRLIGPPRTSFGPPFSTQNADLNATTMPETLQHAFVVQFTHTTSDDDPPTTRTDLLVVVRSVGGSNKRSTGMKPAAAFRREKSKDPPRTYRYALPPPPSFGSRDCRPESRSNTKITLKRNTTHERTRHRSGVIRLIVRSTAACRRLISGG